MNVPLTTALADGAPEGVSVPAYDQTALTAGVAHIGVGNFHRTHQALYLDELLDRHPDRLEWGIVGIGLTSSPAAAAKAAAYRDQDCLYSVTILGNDGSRRTRIVGAMVEYLYGPDDPDAVVARLADPAIRIVSLTVTEGGYSFDEDPHSTFGVLVAALRARRDAGTAPFTVVSCDNLRSNGDTARRATLEHARATDADLAAWIEEHVSFPNSMVDRIAPTIDAAARDEANAASGLDDALPATAEEFTQWVMEDAFPAGRPALEEVGVQMRPDVKRFEYIKGRLLNASHVLLSYPAAVAGLTYVSEASGDPLFDELITTFMREDSAPHIDAPSDVSLADYQASVVERFQNPNVPDTVLRVASDGASKIPVFHRATCDALRETGGDLRREALLLACYRRYCTGVDEQGAAFEALEPHLTEADRALIADPDPVATLDSSPFADWGLRDDERFLATYREAAGVLDADGVRAAVRWALA